MNATVLNRLQSLFFFLLILFLPTQLGKHFWPDFAFVRGQRVDYLSPTIYVTDILAFLCISLWIVQKNNFQLASRIVKNKFNDKKIILFALFSLFLSIGIVLSKSPFAGWYQLLKFFEFILLGFAVKDFLKKQTGTHAFSLPLAIGIIFESLLAVWQSMHQGSIGGLFYFFGERTFTGTTPGIANASINGALVLRPYATFSHPNVLAAYLVIGMFIIASTPHDISRMKKGFFALSFIAGTIALILTFSRVAILIWLVLVVFKIYSFLKSFVRFKVHNLYFISLLAVCSIVFFALFPSLRYRLFSTSFSDESITSRIALLQLAWNMILSHPIFGVGLGNFFNNIPLILNTSGTTFLLQPVHNIFFLIAAETGIPGLLFFLWFLLKTLHTAKTQVILLGILLILGMFDHYFLTLQQGQLLLTMTLGTCWAML